MLKADLRRFAPCFAISAKCKMLFATLLSFSDVFRAESPWTADLLLSPHGKLLQLRFPLGWLLAQASQTCTSICIAQMVPVRNMRFQSENLAQKA
jgi:hypothetical protein